MNQPAQRQELDVNLVLLQFRDKEKAVRQNCDEMDHIAVTIRNAYVEKEKNIQSLEMALNEKVIYIETLKKDHEDHVSVLNARIRELEEKIDNEIVVVSGIEVHEAVA